MNLFKKYVDLTKIRDDLWQQIQRNDLDAIDVLKVIGMLRKKTIKPSLKAKIKNFMLRKIIEEEYYIEILKEDAYYSECTIRNSKQEIVAHSTLMTVREDLICAKNTFFNI